MRIIILLLILAAIILFILLLINKDNDGYVDNKKTKKDYRLGDIVKYYGIKKYNISTDYVNKYPGTIGHEYAHLTSKQNDIDTLTEIVQKRLKSYPKKSFAIHLRLGDVLCIPNDNKKPISAIDFSNIINKLCPENQEKVLFYGNHTGTCVDESKQYIDACVSNIPNLIISANQDADGDFCTMINSQNFIAGKGGLSELVVLVRKKLGRYSIVDDRISGYIIKNRWCTHDPNLAKNVEWAMGYKMGLNEKNDKFVYLGKYDIPKIIKENNIDIEGILHIGAHEAQEESMYNNTGVKKDKIYWVEGNPNICSKMKKKKPDLKYIQALISDVDNEIIDFNISNNGQSSSIMELGTHKELHPEVNFINTIRLPSSRIDTLCKNHNITNINFIHLDIQGAELKALKSCGNDILNFVQVINCEVSREKLYQGSPHVSEIDYFLEPYGFSRKYTDWRTRGWGDALYIKNKEKYENI